LLPLPLAAHQLLLGADLPDLPPQVVHLGALVLHPRENVAEQREEQGNVLRYELRLHRLAN
ncbi:MAG: hypothetical protein ACK56I_14060, partial [bacterium]